MATGEKDTAIDSPRPRERPEAETTARGTPTSAPTAHNRRAAERRAGLVRAGLVPGKPTTPTSNSRSLRTMYLDEALRTQRFVVVAFVLVLCLAPSVFWLGGHPMFQWAFLGSLLLTLLALAHLIWRIRDLGWYSPARAMPAAIAGAVSATLACQWFGVYSAGVVIVPLLIYFFSLSSSLPLALVGVFLMAIPQAVTCVLIALGVMPDYGLTTAEQDTLAMLTFAAQQQALFALTFVFGRFSRRATVAAMDELERERRRGRAREALVQEANAALERALAAGGAAPVVDTVGPWQLLGALGRGGMGEVYEAEHVDTGRAAAVKLLSPEVASDPAYLRRFFREAEAMARLASDHVVEIYDFGDGSDGPVYIAMERLVGDDLGRVLRQTPRLPLSEVVEMVRQVADALEAAHAQNIVHRDIKPANLFRCTGPPLVWKVLDFGISKLGATGTLTAGHMVGTPGYMAPEQVGTGSVDARADVFSLAAAAYRALTGHPPFSGSKPAQVLFDLVYRQPARPGDLIEAPEDVERVLALGLAKDSRDRLGTARELVEALTRAAIGDLPRAVRLRADDLLERHPWGARLST